MCVCECVHVSKHTKASNTQLDYSVNNSTKHRRHNNGHPPNKDDVGEGVKVQVGSRDLYIHCRGFSKARRGGILG